MNFIEANGVGLRYELSGSGERTVVLIHEMGGSLESWDEVAPRLAASRRVLRYDTRGAGLSEKVRGALSIDTMVDDLAALMDALGITGKVALAGIAVGGAIALHAAARLPAAHLRRRGGQPGHRRRARPASRRCWQRVDGHRARRHAQLGRGLDGQRLRARAAPDAARFAAFRARWLGNDPASYATIYRMLAGMDLQPELAPSPARCWCSAALSTACARPRWLSRSPARSPARATRCWRPATTCRWRRRSCRSRHRRFPGRGRRLNAAAARHRKLVRGQSWNRPNPLL